MSTSQPNGSRNGTPTKSSLEADIALLQKLLSADIDESDPENVAELLKRLEAAEGLADGVEDRLDGIIDHLDTLLSDLEMKQVDGTVEMSEVDGGAVEVVTEGKADPAGQSAASKS